MREHRCYQSAGHRTGVELRANPDGSSTLTGYGAVFGQYSQNLGGFVEIIDRGAFDGSFDRGDVWGLVNHDINWILATTESNTLALETDDTGLRYEMTLDPDDPDAVRAMRKVKTRKLTGSSFSFNVARDGDTWELTDQGFPLRRISRFERIYDTGPVLSPAYLGTKDEGTAAALRSLADVCGEPIDVLVAAASRGELRSFVPDSTPADTRQHPGAQDSTPGDTATRLAVMRRRLDLIEHAAPAA